MNKQEFRSAYSKIALSEEFKAQAKAKLVEQFGKAEEKYPSDNVIEEHQATAIKLTPKRRNPWKAIAGVGTAAAVVGLGIWGGSMWLDRTQNPLDDQPTTEVIQTEETADIAETSEEIISSITSDMVQHSVTFPAYYDNETEYNKDIFSAVPFELDITLPEKWEIVVPEKEQRSGFSAVDIVADGEIVGSIDFNIYDKYEGIKYGDPNYHQMVYNQLFLGSVINWNADYTEVKTDGWLKSATCSIYHDPANGYADDVGYTSGILAYKDDMQVYVNIYFNEVLDEKLHAEIAKSINISESTAGLAYRLACEIIETEGFSTKAETYLHINAVDTSYGLYVIVSYPTDDVHTTTSIYEIKDNKYFGHTMTIADISDMIVYDSDNGLLLETSTGDRDGKKSTQYYLYTHPMTLELLAEFDYTYNYTGDYYDIVYNKSTPLTYDQMAALKDELTNSYTYVAYTLAELDIRENLVQCDIDSVSALIEQVLNNTERLPEEEPAPMPPNLYLDAEGAERPLLMCSYTWGEGLDEFHHDGWTIEDAVQALKNPIYPASWFDDARLIVPDGSVITSVKLHTDELNYTELQFTADGAIILPDEPVGEHIRVTIEYPEGACEYLMTVDFPEMADPPAVTLNGKELTIGSYIWNGALSGDHPRNADVWQMFLSGELLTVMDESTIQLTMPEGARLLDAICFDEDMESEMMLGCEESGEVRLPTASTKSEGVIRLGVEYSDGSVSYWFGFKYETAAKPPEALSAISAEGIRFELQQSEKGWSDKTLFTLDESEYIEITLPEDTKITNARAIDLEDGSYDLIFTEDGKVWMPYYDRMVVSLTINNAQSECEYQFIHNTNSIPAISIDTGYSTIIPVIGSWGWAYLFWEPEEYFFDAAYAFEMCEKGEMPIIQDNADVKVILPQYTKLYSAFAYDKDGNETALPITNDIIVTMPETNEAIIKLYIRDSLGGTCTYWFSHYWSTCGSMEAESTQA